MRDPRLSRPWAGAPDRSGRASLKRYDSGGLVRNGVAHPTGQVGHR